MTALGNEITDALIQFVETLFDPLTTFIKENADPVLSKVVGTPAPSVVFSRPPEAPWGSFYEYYWHDIVPLSLLLWALAVGLVIFLESMSHVFGNYHQARLKRRAFTGLVGILSWWWVAALSLRFMDALAGVLLPDLSNVTLFDTVSVSAVSVLALVLSASVDLALFVLIALIYLLRQMVLYLFIILIPILIALWVPGIGPFAFVSRFVERLAGFYVPFLLMPIPVAILLHLGKLIGDSVAFDGKGILLWITALVIPIIAIISPFVLIWQAGSLLSTGNRMANRVSIAQGRNRVNEVSGYGRDAVHGGRNMSRGVRGDLAVRRDGQHLLDGGSNAHAVGRQLGTSGATLRNRIAAYSTETRRLVSTERNPSRSLQHERREEAPSREREKKQSKK